MLFRFAFHGQGVGCRRCLLYHGRRFDLLQLPDHIGDLLAVCVLVQVLKGARPVGGAQHQGIVVVRARLRHGLQSFPILAVKAHGHRLRAVQGIPIPPDLVDRDLPLHPVGDGGLAVSGIVFVLYDKVNPLAIHGHTERFIYYRLAVYRQLPGVVGVEVPVFVILFQARKFIIQAVCSIEHTGDLLSIYQDLIFLRSISCAVCIPVEPHHDVPARRLRGGAVPDLSHGEGGGGLVGDEEQGVCLPVPGRGPGRFLRLAPSQGRGLDSRCCDLRPVFVCFRLLDHPYLDVTIAWDLDDTVLRGRCCGALAFPHDGHIAPGQVDGEVLPDRVPRVILPEGISRFVRRSAQIKVRARNIGPVRVIRPVFGIDSDSCLGLFQILHFQSDVRQVIRFVFLRIVLPLLLREDLRGLEGVGGGGGVVGLRSVRRLSVQGVVRQRLGFKRSHPFSSVFPLRGHGLSHRLMHIGREVGGVEGAAALYDRGGKVAACIIPRLELHGAVLAVGEAR